MRIIEDIFYTNLTDDLTKIIAKIRQNEIINDYTIFIIYTQLGYRGCLKYFKFWKSHDCIVSDIDTYYSPICSNGKYLFIQQGATFDDFKKRCDDYDLLKKHIKFTYKMINQCELEHGFRFYFGYWSLTPIECSYKRFTIDEFIHEILTNHTEFYNYDQIKPVVH